MAKITIIATKKYPNQFNSLRKDNHEPLITTCTQVSQKFLKSPYTFTSSLIAYNFIKFENIHGICRQNISMIAGKHEGIQDHKSIWTEHYANHKPSIPEDLNKNNVYSKLRSN